MAERVLELSDKDQPDYTNAIRSARLVPKEFRRHFLRMHEATQRASKFFPYSPASLAEFLYETDKPFTFTGRLDLNKDAKIETKKEAIRAHVAQGKSIPNYIENYIHDTRQRLTDTTEALNITAGSKEEVETRLLFLAVVLEVHQLHPPKHDLEFRGTIFEQVQRLPPPAEEQP